LVIRLEKKKKPNLKKFFDIIEFDWEGGLEELKDKYTSVELQHEAMNIMRQLIKKNWRDLDEELLKKIEVHKLKLTPGESKWVGDDLIVKKNRDRSISIYEINGEEFTREEIERLLESMKSAREKPLIPEEEVFNDE